ncbi:unnamed protein product, partial [Candidula unifasciata]
ILMAQKDQQHFTVFKIRRCFLWNNQYFQLDVYQEPAPPRCKGLILLETFTTERDTPTFPSFLTIEREVTNDPNYSMFNLSQKGDLVHDVDSLDDDSFASFALMNQPSADN